MAPRKPAVTLLIPVLNEISGLREIMPRVRREWVDEIVFIDGGSTDGTLEFIERGGWRLLRQKSRGITYAYQEALEALDTDVVIAFSPDGNSVPERIPDLVAKMGEGYDMVVVSRYMGGAKSEDDDFLTGIGNWGFTKAINLLFGGRYTDSLVMFRAFRREIVRGFPRGVPRAGLEPMLAIRCAKLGLKTAEIPGDEPARIGGQRKMQPFLNGLDILRLIALELRS